MPTTPIIDCHLHVWADDRTRYPWAAPNPRLEPTRGSGEFLLECMDAAGVAGAVIIQPILYRWDHTYVNETLRRFPDRFAGVALVNPADPHAPAELERLVQEEGYRGFRVNPNLYPEGVGLDSDISDRLLEIAARLDLGVGYLIDPVHFPGVEALAQRHPEVRMVIDHFGHCHARDGGPAENAHLQRLVQMARFPNLYVKLTEFPRASMAEYPYADLWPWTQALLEAYGPRRLMWGTDFPFIVEQCGYTEGLELLSKATPGIPAEALPWLLGGTASQFYASWLPADRES